MGALPAVLHEGDHAEGGVGGQQPLPLLREAGEVTAALLSTPQPRARTAVKETFGVAKQHCIYTQNVMCVHIIIHANTHTHISFLDYSGPQVGACKLFVYANSC